MMKKTFYIATALLFILNAYAMELPQNCHLVSIKSENMNLKGQKERLIFIHNMSKMDLYLSHISKDDPGVQAGWTSRINKNKWNVLKLGKKEMTFQCVEFKPGHEQQISCQNILSVCQIVPAEKPVNDKGNYWVAENQSLSKILETVSSRGFQLISNDEKDG